MDRMASPERLPAVRNPSLIHNHTLGYVSQPQRSQKARQGSSKSTIPLISEDI